MRILKIFCQRGHKYCSNGNFGDNLSKFILEKSFSCNIKYVSPKRIETSFLVGIGSILQRVPENYNGIIWTSGFLYNSKPMNFDNANIVAVRGRGTLDLINCKNKENIILGDGGLICSCFFGKMPCRKYKLGIIPHYIDKNNPTIKIIADKNKEIKIIDVCGCENVINDILECEYIISSSLHGLVVADSFNIPNEWIKLGNRVKGNGFKFRDYYSVFDLENKEPMLLDESDNLKSIIDKINAKKYIRKNIEIIKNKLAKSLLNMATFYFR